MMVNRFFSQISLIALAMASFAGCPNSSQSNEIGNPPNPPDKLTAVASDESTISVSWRDRSDVEQGFRLERSDDNRDTSTTTITELPPNTTAYEDAGLAAATSYTYLVIAFNDFGESLPSGPATATTHSAGTQPPETIIADHTVVERYDDIPTAWINEVKKMLLNIPGQSHGRAYVHGLELLEDIDPRYAISTTWNGEPEGSTDEYLRVARSYRDGSFWSTTAGEQDFWTNDEAIANMKAYLDYMHDADNPVHAFGFGWCWDMTWHNAPGGNPDDEHHVRWAGSSEGGPDGNRRWGLDEGDTGTEMTDNVVTLQTYLDAVVQYDDHNDNTIAFFTTGPVDGYLGESGYQRYLKHEAIRDYVNTYGGVLFDYADILSWNDAGEQHTTTWTDHDGNLQTFQIGDPLLATGGSGYEGSHISEEACLRLGKALWWMLARIAGWEG